MDFMNRGEQSFGLLVVIITCAPVRCGVLTLGFPESISNVPLLGLNALLRAPLSLMGMILRS